MTPPQQRSRPGSEGSKLLVSSLLLVAVVLGIACGATTETPESPGQQTTSGEVVVTGTLTDEGVECPALRGDDGELYTLTGAALDGIETGDRLRLRGSVAELSYCMQGRTIDVGAVERLDPDA